MLEEEQNNRSLKSSFFRIVSQGIFPELEKAGFEIVLQEFLVNLKSKGEVHGHHDHDHHQHHNYDH